MFYYLGLALKQHARCFNIVRYTSFRMMASLLTALFLFFIMGPWFMRLSKRFFSAQSREYAPSTHKAKDGVPIMGGLLIIGIVLITSLLWCQFNYAELWILLAGLIGYGAIGFWDDFSKIKYRKGIPEKHKFIAQIAFACILAIAWSMFGTPPSSLCVPFFKNLNPTWGLLLVPWTVFIIVATANAVNLSDGLDGLAIGSLAVNFATYTALLYICGNIIITQYLHIPFINNSEIAVVGAALIGSSLGFLWYNAYPAHIFMGDVGSLALGAALALMALFSGHELLLVLSGGVFVVVTLSVIAQILSCKLRGKRLFKMAPIHHHFELLGWHESTITIRFTIISIVLCILTLMTLKIR